MVFFALLEYTQNKRHRKICRPQQVILNDAVEQPMEAGGLTALTQAHFNEAMKIVAQRFINAALQGELEHHLTREYENLNEEESAAERVENKRNGHSKKTLHGNKGDLEIQISPRSQGDLCPRLVPKHSRHFNDFDDAIIDLYGRGLSTREITEFIRSHCPKSIFFLGGKLLPPISDAEATPSAGHGETGLSSATLVAFHPEDEGGRSRTISAPKENITENLLIFKALAYNCPGPLLHSRLTRAKYGFSVLQAPLCQLFSPAAPF
ncbi:MAG: transposase [Duodenibacillus massiliensis]